MVVVDCGLMFPDDEMYGVDIVINDFTYVRERADEAASAARDTRARRSHRRHSIFRQGVSADADRRHAADDCAYQSKVARAAPRRSRLHAGRVRKPRALRLDRSGVRSRQSFGRRAPARSQFELRLGRSSTPAISSSTRLRSTANPRTSRELRASVTRACFACSRTRRMPNVQVTRSRSGSSARPLRRSSLMRKDGSSLRPSLRTFPGFSRPSTMRCASIARLRS